MNISPSENMQMAMRRGVDPPLPLAAHHPGDRHRHHHGGDGGLAAHRPARRAWWCSSRNSAPTISSSSAPPATRARTASIPKERQAPRAQARVRRFHQALVLFGGRRGARACDPAGGGWQSHHGAGSGLRIRHHQRGRPCRPTWPTFRRAISTSGRFFTPEEDQRGAHVAMLGDSVAEALFPDGPRGGRHHHDGWRGVHRGRRVRQGQGRLLRRERHGQRRRHPAAHGREPLPAGGPLHDHGQGQARHAAGGLRRSGRRHAPHPPPGHRARTTIFPSPRPTRSSSSSTTSPG